MKKFLGLLSFVFSFYTCSALDPAHFSVTRITSPYFVIDGNSPATGPRSAYMGIKVTNTSASNNYNNLKLSFTSISSSVVGQNYNIASPANSTAVVGTLAPGESKVVYFYVTYPAHTTAQGTFNFVLNDATATGKMGNFIIRNRSSISANAGGLATQSINNQDLIGGIVYDDVTYTLGNIRNGDEADFQVSVSTQFDPSKLVLLKTQVIASTVPGVPVNSTDQLYFTTTANQSSGTVTIRWTFRISSYNFTSLILPYAGATSGSTNYKYAISTDLGSGTPITVSSTANPLLITKTSDKAIYGPESPALFSVTIQNPGSYGITIDKITDEIPVGFTYQAIDASSAVHSANSTTTPASGSTGTITFEGGVNSAGNTSYIVPAHGSIILKYWALSAPISATNLLTTSKGFIGGTQFGAAQNSVIVSTTLPVKLVNFSATWQDSKAKLIWESSAESNSSHFEIERATSSDQFQKIGRVNANGNSAIQNSYSFIDSFSLSGRNRYRLKMVDIDGRFEYGPIVSLQSNIVKSELGAVYPNPFVDEIQFSLSLLKDERVQLSIVDERGVLILKETRACHRGSNVIVLPQLKKLNAGIFFLRLQTGNQIMSAKILKFQ